MKKCFFLFILSLVSVSTFALAGRQGISLSHTRVIVNESKLNTVITIRNDSDQPWLIKAQSLMSAKDTEKAPFYIIPPLFRLEPHSQNTVRILNQDTKKLPKDRESVFYLSFLAIPASEKSGVLSSSDVSAQVTMGIETVIKLFYRPDNLIKNNNGADLVVDYQKQKIKISNHTPYYQTLSSLSIDDHAVSFRDTGGMIPPFESNSYDVISAIKKPKVITWTIINDHGDNSPVYQVLWN